MKKNSFLGLIICGLSFLIIYKLCASPVDDIENQRKELESKKNDLADLKKQLQDVFHSINSQVGSQIDSTVSKNITPLRKTLVDTQDQLNKIPSTVLKIFDPTGITGLADTKKVVSNIISILDQTTSLLENKVKKPILACVQPIDTYSHAAKREVYDPLDQAVTLLESASKDLLDMEELIKEVLPSS